MPAETHAADDISPASVAASEQTRVLTGNTGGFQNYRCPALIRTGAGTLLLSTDARNADSDWGWIELVVCRSTDSGRTWSEPIRVNQTPPPPRTPSNPLQRVQTTPPSHAKPSVTTFSNQTFIASASGAIHLLYFADYSRVMYRRSDDDGITWSESVEATAEAFAPFHERYPWRVIAAGPGSGIELRHGPHRGRLVVPVWMSRGGAEHGGDHRPSVTATVYSDDHGSTWQPGQITAHEGQPLLNPSENVLVELSDGRVMCNIRSESDTHRRAVTISPDGVSQWTPPRFIDELFEPVCHAGLTNLPGVPRQPQTLVFSNPDTSHLDGPVNELGFYERRNLTVYASPDDGATWPHRRPLVTRGVCGYSALVSAPDGTIWCAFEHQDETAEGPPGYCNIHVARFDLDWVKSAR